MRVILKSIVFITLISYSGIIISQPISPTLKDYLQGLENRKWLKAKLLEVGLSYWVTLKLPIIDKNDKEGIAVIEEWGFSYIKDNDTIRAINVSISESFIDDILIERYSDITVAVNREFGSEYIEQLKSDINRLFPTKEAVKHTYQDKYYLRYSGYPNGIVIEVDKAGMDDEKNQWSIYIRYLDSE